VYAQGLQYAAMRQWRSLTDSQRAAWEAAARQYPVRDRFGLGRAKTGLQLYMGIPHDFRFGYMEQWLGLPPTISTPQLGWGNAAASAGYNLTIEYNWIPTVPHLAFAYVARFQPPSGGKGHKTWRRVAQDFVGTWQQANFSASLEANDCYFIKDERIAVVGGLYVVGNWPVTHDYGVITVGE